jgi:anti-sigma-K factor RskA
MTIDDRDHRPFREAAALYAADALTADERAALEAHARTCQECARELRSFDAVTLALALAVPQIDPPPGLRERVVNPSRTPRDATGFAPTVHRAPRWSAGWLSAAALLVATLGLVRYTSSLKTQIAVLQQELRETIARLERGERQLAAATQAANGAEIRMAVLMAPDVARVDLAGQPAAPRAAGRAFWSRSRGLVFAASALPPLPAGRTYQFWVVTSDRAISAGLVEPDPRGSVTTFFATPPDIPVPIAMALSIEPAGGVPAPTGDKYLVGVAH